MPFYGPRPQPHDVRHIFIKLKVGTITSFSKQLQNSAFRKRRVIIARAREVLHFVLHLTFFSYRTQIK